MDIFSGYVLNNSLRCVFAAANKKGVNYANPSLINPQLELLNQTAHNDIKKSVKTKVDLAVEEWREARGTRDLGLEHELQLASAVATQRSALLAHQRELGFRVPQSGSTRVLKKTTVNELHLYSEVMPQSVMEVAP